MKYIFYLVVYLQLLQFALAGYGDETNGLPLWQERAAHAMTNAVRTGESCR